MMNTGPGIVSMSHEKDYKKRKHCSVVNWVEEYKPMKPWVSKSESAPVHDPPMQRPCFSQREHAPHGYKDARESDTYLSPTLNSYDFFGKHKLLCE